MDNPNDRKKALVWSAAALLLSAMLLQALLSMRLLSATFDETTHLSSGYSYIITGDFRLNPQHPPFIKILSALPLLPLQPEMNLEDPAWSESPYDEWSFGYRFLYGNEADRLLFWGRLPNVLLSLLMAFYVFRWARELFGEASGLTALFLCAFSPTIIAHARLVTFDVGLACFSTIALYHLRHYLLKGKARHLCLAGLGLGMAMASKFSGLLLLPIFALLFGWSLIKPAAGSDGGARRTVFGFVIALALALLVVQASYFFSGDPLLYWKSLRQVNADHDPGYHYYLMGEFKVGGWWHYFLLAFLFKTPLPTLTLIPLAIFLMRRYRAPALQDELFLILPVLFFAAVTSAMADNLGIRYLLPVYPLIFIFISRVARSIARFKFAGVMTTVLALWYAIAAIVIYPDHLAYFNELVGGPGRGHRYLDDSNIDWGQDLKRLAIYLEERGIDSVKLRYGRNDAPAYYGINSRPITDAEWKSDSPPPGIYAFGTHLLIRGELYARQRGLKTDWLSRHRPADRIGYSIYIFEFD
jgi:4-amino-4-deoxy-L-arabinose transferase-like glycosyltransferase